MRVLTLLLLCCAAPAGAWWTTPRLDPLRHDQAAFDSGLRAAFEAQEQEAVDVDACTAPSRRGFE